VPFADVTPANPVKRKDDSGNDILYTNAFIMPDEDVTLEVVIREIEPSAELKPPNKMVYYVRSGGTKNPTAAQSPSWGTSWARASGDLQAMIDRIPGTVPAGQEYEVWIAGGEEGVIDPYWAYMLASPPTWTTVAPYAGTANRPDWIHPTPGVTPDASKPVRAWAFVLRSGVQVYGGFWGTETHSNDKNTRPWKTNKTILSGVNNSSSHVVIGSSVDETALLDGVTITGGRAIQGGDQYPVRRPVPTELIQPTAGGGMYNLNASPRLNNVTFELNYAALGGAMVNFNSSPVLTGVVMESNTSTMYASGAEGGGGICNFNGSKPLIIGSTIRGNNGGGMVNHHETSYDSSFGITSIASQPIVINSLFNGNAGSGIRSVTAALQSSSILINTTVENNTRGVMGGNLDKVYNSLIRNNTESDLKNRNDATDFINPVSSTIGTGVAGPGVNGNYPLVISGTTVTGTLATASPYNSGGGDLEAVHDALVVLPTDAQTAVFKILKKDIDGDNRVNGTSIDQGAKEN
jgi:hypothetical protein